MKKILLVSLLLCLFCTYTSIRGINGLYSAGEEFFYFQAPDSNGFQRYYEAQIVAEYGCRTYLAIDSGRYVEKDSTITLYVEREAPFFMVSLDYDTALGSYSLVETPLPSDFDLPVKIYHAGKRDVILLSNSYSGNLKTACIDGNIDSITIMRGRYKYYKWPLKELSLVSPRMQIVKTKNVNPGVSPNSISILCHPPGFIQKNTILKDSLFHLDKPTQHLFFKNLNELIQFYRRDIEN